MIGYTEYTGFGGRDVLVIKLDAGGNVTWQKTYGGNGDDYACSITQATDGGYIINGKTSSFGDDGLYAWVLKVNDSGTIPGCDIISSSNIPMTLSEHPNPWMVNGCCSPTEVNPVTVIDTNAVSQDYSAVIDIICLADSDEDGIYDEDDNCSLNYNPLQEDTCPPQGNDIGDVCDCEGDFDCDGDVDGTDAAMFKADFGRSTYDPCTELNNCFGDFNCDTDIDGSDASIFKADFGRGEYNAPCPSCTNTDPWCSY